MSSRDTHASVASVIDDPTTTVLMVVASEPSPGNNNAVTAGQSTITYVLTATNSGGSASGPVVVSDPVPLGTTYVALSATCGATANCTVAAPSGASDVVTFSFSALAPGASSALSFQVTVNAEDANQLEITDSASFTNANTSGCSTSTCPTNDVRNSVVVPIVSAAGTATHKKAPSGSTASTVARTASVGGATSVHTGEPWAGSGPLVAAVICAGSLLLACGEALRRKRSPTSTEHR